MSGDIKLSGLASGIDGAGFAKTVFDQLTTTNALRRNQIQDAQTENSSLERLRTLLLSLADSIDAFRSIYGGTSAKTAASTNIAVLTAAAGQGAEIGSYSINVLSLAQVGSGSFDRSFSSASDVIISSPDNAGSVEFTVGDGEDAHIFSVSVDESTTMQDFVDQFNTQADGRAVASVINLGTEQAPDFRIRFSSTEQGFSKGSLSVSSDNALLFENDALGSTTISQAANARVTVSGISGVVERGSNTISDLIPGLTLHLSSVGSAQLNISQDVEASASQLEAFVSAYNSLVTFVKGEDLISVSTENGEAVNEYGSLARTDVDDSALADLRSVLLSTSSSAGLTLASFGVSTNRDGTLAFDREAFDRAVGENPQAIQEIETAIADAVGNTGGVVSRYTGYGREIDLAEQANQSEIAELQDKISSVESHANERADSVQRQFTTLEGLLARLNLDSSIISQLLSF